MNYVCNKCLCYKNLQEMSPIKKKDISLYYYCKRCVSNKRNEYQKKKRRERGLRKRGQPKRVYNVIIGAEEIIGLTLDDLHHLTGISKGMLRHKIKGRINKYPHINITAEYVKRTERIY